MKADKRAAKAGDGFTATWHDDSKRRQDIESPVMSEQMYRCLFEYRTDALMIVDADTLKFENVNRSTLELFGYSTDEILQMKITDVSVEKDKIIKEINESIKNRAAHPRGPLIVPSHFMTKKDDTIIMCEIAIGSFVSKGRKKIICSVRDIGLQNKIENMLLEREEQHDILFNHVFDAYLILNDEGNIFDANTEACKLYGYTYEEIIKLNRKDLVHPDYHHLFKQYLSDIERKGESYIEETDFRKDGTLFYVESKGTDFEYRGMKCILSVVRDITERRTAGRKLRDLELNLQIHKTALEQKDITLREMIGQINTEKNKLKEDIADNVEYTLLPLVLKLKSTGESFEYVDLLKYHLETLVSSFGRNINGKEHKLTPKEIEICNMIKGGLSSKNICSLLNVSELTIAKHRINIRKKLQISHRKANLASFLHSL